MGIRVVCPNGHRLNLKVHLAGRRGLCPECNARFRIPFESSDDPQPFAEPPERKSPGANGSTTSVPGIGRQSAGMESVRMVDSDAAMDGSNETSADPNSIPMALPVHQPRNIATDASNEVWGDANTVWYVQPPGGEQYGPASPDVFREWLAEGRIGADCQVWRDDWSEWRLASTLDRHADVAGIAAPAPDSVDATPRKSVDGVATTLLPSSTESDEVPRHLAYVRRRSSSNFGMAILILLALVGLVLLVGFLILVQNGQLSLGPGE